MNRPQLIGRRLSVTGQVQGVGFRPFVYNLARRLGLAGQVLNDGEGVQIDLQGSALQHQAFLRGLAEEAPSMAIIDAVRQSPLEPLPGLRNFRIVASSRTAVRTGVTPDAAVCEACLDELFDPGDRRYRYPFINCTHCGPRYTLIRRLPYDRPHTTMAAFPLCPACQAEYGNPEDRRFHAQPLACPTCGPRLRFVDPRGCELPGIDPVTAALASLARGEVVALKGVGGFHLACDARNAAAVARLRARKQRDEKPFAVMAANVASLDRLVALTPGARRRLQAADAPILLARARDADGLPGLAPGLAWYGVMLPHAPLHHLLFHEAAGRPAGRAWLCQPQELLLVMTSANRSGEPLVTDNRDALTDLADLADYLLVHDRDIEVRCDDSLLHGDSDPPAVIRRGRGLAPQVIALPQSGPSVLAVGGFFKNTICLTRGNRAYVSQYIGDLDNPACCRALDQTVEHLCQLLEIEPDMVARDLHPDIYSSRFAESYAGGRGLPVIQVQHHQAHILAVLAEAGHGGSALGLALDGLGLGSDGSLWGGELLRVEGSAYQRLAHLRPLALPGGDRAAREPWRMAAGVLHQLGRGEEIERRFADQPAAPLVYQMLERNLNCPPTSSAGRLFDAAAGLLGVQPVAGYEAQAAMRLESLALQYGCPSAEPLLVRFDQAGNLDPLPLLARLAELDDPEYGAALFHAQLLEGLEHWVLRHWAGSGLDTLVLSGGCFLNQILANGLEQRMGRHGLRVLRARQLPCNDGGLSLGQAWAAMQTPAR